LPRGTSGSTARTSRLPATCPGRGRPPRDERGWFLGKAFYGSRSQIAVRLLTREDEPVDEQFFVHRLVQAIALRDVVRPDSRAPPAMRLVHGEADLLPG